MKDLETALSHGLTPHPTRHSMKRRARWHDYAARCIFMITLCVEGRRPLLGRLCGEPDPHVALSPLGEQILWGELKKIPQFYPNVEVWKSIIMPDHMHFIIYVREPFEREGQFSIMINGFKQGCTRYCKQAIAGWEGPLF